MVAKLPVGVRRRVCACVCSWDAASRTWTVVAPMAGARSTCGVAALRGRLYAAGGRDGGACLRSLECYDPATNHWHNCAPMTRRRCGLSVTHRYILYTHTLYMDHKADDITI